MALGITHSIFALLVGTGALALLGTGGPPSDILPFLAFVFLGGLLPDIDHPASIIGRKAKPISWPLNWLVKHRGLLHSMIGAVGLMVVLELILRALRQYRSPLPLAFLLGYVSHLLLDAATKEGVEPFFPAPIRWQGSTKTGSMLEWLLVLVMGAVLVRYWVF